MRRVWFRTAAVSDDARPPVDVTRLAAARAALVATPDLRQKHAELAKLLVRQGGADDLDAVTSTWATRDPLDADLLTARAASRAWRGDRDGTLRILSGLLVSPGLAPAVQSEIAATLARAEERAGHPALACALREGGVESKPDDEGGLAAVLACARGASDADAARWSLLAKDDAARTRVAAAAAKLSAAPREDALFGDVVVDATWDSGAGADLDVAVIDPGGRRLAWASSNKGVRARDCTSRTHEALAVSSGSAGAFAVEVVRADAGELGRSVSGKLRITSMGNTRVVPFVLSGDRAQVARVDVRFESRLEPVSSWQTW